jgi:hypothetical protein
MNVDAGADARVMDGAQGGTGPSPAKAKFCRDWFPLLCKRTFECFPPAQRNERFKMHYGESVEECTMRLGSGCDGFGNGCTFNPSYAQMCLAEIPTVECDTFDSSFLPPSILPPASCLGVCPLGLDQP